MALSAREQKFALEYLVDGNATQAAIRAGYSKRTARSIGSENLTKLDIVQAIQAARKPLEAATIADAKERREVLTALLRSAEQDANARIRAIDVANKMDGLYIEKHEHAGPDGAPLVTRVVHTFTEDDASSR